jgi:hypothetical protein
MLGTTTLDFNMNDDNNKIMVTKQYHFNADITFECEYENVEAAYNADAPINFDKYELVNVKLVKSLIKKKGETDATNVSASTSGE